MAQRTNSGPGADSASPRSLRPRSNGDGLESTASLVFRAQDGDDQACNLLFARCVDDIHRFATGRLPAAARDLSETKDLVQVCLLRAFNNLDGFEPRHRGAFHAYLRRIVMNQVRDEIRRAGHRPRLVEFSDEFGASSRTPFDDTVTKQSFGAYERALAQLPPRTQRAVALRLELGLTYEEIAHRVGSLSSNATRMRITRALVQMAEAMNATERAR